MEMESRVSVTDIERTRFFGRTYGWMALALLISAISAFLTANMMVDSTGNPTALFKMIYGSRFGYLLLAFGELALVWWLSASIRKISVTAAKVGFLVYSVLNGLTLAAILFIYEITSIASAFFGCSAMFLVMCIYGSTTKKNLSTIGRYCIMGLIGIIITSLVQILISFFTGARLEKLDFIVAIATVIIFTGLTMWDAQKVSLTARNADGSDDYKKVAILAALELYLDFINLFLALLRIFGRRR